MRRPGDVLTRLHLLEHAWDFAYENRSNIVDVYVSYGCAKDRRAFRAERRWRRCAAPATGCAPTAGA